MHDIRPVEGFFVETPEGLIFDVKGVLHPVDRTIAYLRYYPDVGGTRERAGTRYSKVYDLGERRQWLVANYPKYLWQCDQWGMEVQAVPNDEMITHDPRRKLAALQEVSEEKLPLAELNARELCNLLQAMALDSDEVGITGSILVDLAVADSDYDLVVFGTKNCLAVHSRMDSLFAQDDRVTPYTREDMTDHYQKRAAGSGISLETFAFHELRKTHQGRFRGMDFFIRYVPFPDETIWTFPEIQYSKIGTIRAAGEILDDERNFYTPCSYGVLITEIFQIPESNIDFSLITEINSLRGRFCEQCFEGESFSCRGTLERVTTPGGIYYRVILGNSSSDYFTVQF